MGKEVNTTVESQNWAQDWFYQVDEARKAKDRADKLYTEKRERAFTLPAHVERDTIEMVDAEVDKNVAYLWADEVLNEWDEMMYTVRPGLRGAIGDGLDIANAKYREGLSNKAIRRLFGVSDRTLYRDLKATINYLDYLGPSRGVSDEADPRQATPPIFTSFDDDDLEESQSDYLTDYVPESVSDAMSYLKDLTESLHSN